MPQARRSYRSPSASNRFEMHRSTNMIIILIVGAQEIYCGCSAPSTIYWGCSIILAPAESAPLMMTITIMTIILMKIIIIVINNILVIAIEKLMVIIIIIIIIIIILGLNARRSAMSHLFLTR